MPEAGALMTVPRNGEAELRILREEAVMAEEKREWCDGRENESIEKEIEKVDLREELKAVRQNFLIK